MDFFARKTYANRYPVQNASLIVNVLKLHRSQYNQQVITQAFQAVWQALKQKELELITPVKRTGKEKTTLLVECEKSVGQVTSEFKSVSLFVIWW